MDENTKRRFDGIVELYTRCWQNLYERRTYEWRVAFTLWTAFAVFLAVVLTKSLSAPKEIVFWVSFVMGLILCCIHGVWLHGLGKRNTLDREMAIHYEKLLRGLSNSNFSRELKTRLDEIRKKLDSPLDWSRGSQLAVTVVLYVAVLLMILGTGN